MREKLYIKNAAVKFLVLSIILPCFQLSINAQRDLSVFGMKFGEQFTVPECTAVLNEGTYMNNGGLLGRLNKKKYWEYRYETSAITKQCFKRLDLEEIKFDKKDNVPPLPLPAPKGFVKVVSPAGAKPALTADGEFYAFVLTNRTLDGVNFKTDKNQADEVLAALQKKYGKETKLTPMRWQNSAGAVYDYYIAEWKLPKLLIKFQSAGIFFTPGRRTVIDAMVSRETDNAFASPYGMVQIGQRAQETAPPPANIPL